jgi:spore coat protein U-like protein
MIRRHRVLSALMAAAGVAFLVLGYTAVTSAGSATTALAVSGTVINNCTISTAAVSFGPYDPVVANDTANLDGTGTVTIACTKGTTATITLGTGQNVSGSTRRMKDAGTNFLSYEIYLDSGRTTVWGTTGSNILTPAAAPSRVGRNFTAYGRIPAGQDVPSGSYTDSIQATVNF